MGTQTLSTALYSMFITVLTTGIYPFSTPSRMEWVNVVYIAWIRIDETLPWIELQGEYPTRRAARKAATAYLKSAQVEILELPEKRVAAKPTAQVVIASR